MEADLLGDLAVVVIFVSEGRFKQMWVSGTRLAGSEKINSTSGNCTSEKAYSRGL